MSKDITITLSVKATKLTPEVIKAINKIASLSDAKSEADQLDKQPNPQPEQTVTAPEPAQAPPKTAVPTSSTTYSMEQLAVAATQLVDAGRRNELVELLGQFGVQALTALPKEQYGNFATKIREMGAKL